MNPGVTSAKGSTSDHPPDLKSQELSPAELGRRIKMLRVARDLTLKDLEHRGAVSATHISEIERGKTSPTVVALGRIAQALGVRPSVLTEASTLPTISLARQDERTARGGSPSGCMLEPLGGLVQGTELAAHLMTLPVGRTPALTHRHPGEEWFTVLTGVVEVRVGKSSHVLRDGDTLHFRAHRTHAYLNLSPEPASLFVVTRSRLIL